MSRRLENLDRDRRDRLFACAAEEFAAHGFEGASLNRILKTSGMSKSSLYYYFDDKADLFTTLVERATAAVFRDLGPFDLDALTRETYWDSFEAYYRRAAEMIDRRMWLIRLAGVFYALRASKRGPATDRMFRTAGEWIARALARGQALGTVRADLPQTLLVDSTLALVESLDRWVVTHWAGLTEAQKAALPGDHIALIRRVLAPDVAPEVAPENAPENVPVIAQNANRPVGKDRAAD